MKLWPWLEANKNRLIGAGVAVVAVVGIYSFVSWHSQQAEISAGEAFTQLMMAPPAATVEQTAAAYEVLATKYAGTVAAGRAQLQAAVVLFNAGSYADAQAQFQGFVNNHAGSDLAAPAQLGVANCLETQGQLDAAVGAYEKLIAMAPASTCVVPAEYALGRIAEKQGKLDAAASYYEQAAKTGQAGGPIAQDAYTHMMQIKARLAATQKTPMSATPSLSPSVPLLK